MASNFTVSLVQPVIEKFVTSTDGVQIYATAVGRSHLPALVLAHGLACTALIWANVLQNKDLLDKFYLVAYDLRGHGRSGKPDTPAGYLSSLFADDFASVSRSFSLHSPLFVGWSYGGTVTVDIFSHLPLNSISGIIYVAANGPAPFLELGDITTPFSKDLVPGLINETDATLALKTRQLFVDGFVAEPEKVPIAVKWAWLGGASLASPQQNQLLTFREQNATAILEVGRKGEFPVLLITGGKDRFLNAEPMTALMKKNFVNLKMYHIPQGGHAMFYDSEREFVKGVVEFATSVFKKH